MQSDALTNAAPALDLEQLVRPHMHAALGLLLQAHDYTRELKQGVWDLAVEWPALESAGLSASDLRWLIAQGLVAHGVETTGEQDTARSFEFNALPRFGGTLCVVLTGQGVAAVRQACALAQISAPLAGASSAWPVEETMPSAVPRWDAQRRQLRVAGQIVKEFKLPSPNQETVLTVLEEEGWPPRIDDPLPPQADIDPRRRLHDTIKALNRKQKRSLVRFMGDGRGEGIRWELTADEPTAE